MRTAAANPMSVVLRRRSQPMGLMLDGTRATHASATATAAALSDGASAARLPGESTELLSSEPFERVREGSSAQAASPVGGRRQPRSVVVAPRRAATTMTATAWALRRCGLRADTAALSVPTEFQGGNEGASANRRELKKAGVPTRGATTCSPRANRAASGRASQGARLGRRFARARRSRRRGHTMPRGGDALAEAEASHLRAQQVRSRAQLGHAALGEAAFERVRFERSQSARTPRTSRLVLTISRLVLTGIRRWRSTSLTNSFGKGSVINLLASTPSFTLIESRFRCVRVRSRAPARTSFALTTACCRLAGSGTRTWGCRRSTRWHQESVQDGACARRDQSLVKTLSCDASI